MNDERLREAPTLRKGTVLRPLDCRGPGSHDNLGYLCANAGIEGCLGFVCRRCSAKSLPVKPYTEECNVCQAAAKNGCSMDKALAAIAESAPDSIRKGKSGCASTAIGAKPCRKCVKHTCKRCQRLFRSHNKRGDLCGDLCRRAAAREANRLRQERHRGNSAAA